MNIDIEKLAWGFALGALLYLLFIRLGFTVSDLVQIINMILSLLS